MSFRTILAVLAAAFFFLCSLPMMRLSAGGFAWSPQ